MNHLTKINETSYKIRALLYPLVNKEDTLLGIFGDDQELSLWFSPDTRKCYFKNNSSRVVHVTTNHTDLRSERIDMFVGMSYEIDYVSVLEYGQLSALKDCSLTSRLNTWAFDYGNKCLSSSAFSDNSDCNRIFSNIDLLPLQE